MVSETVQRRLPVKGGSTVAPPPEQEQLPCPRCDSVNTKFCYYNNYNFSQPRHFCKACRRYWTHGGALRDIPVGGGNRKNAKRTRCIAPAPPLAAAASTTTSSAANTAAFNPVCPFAGGGSFTSLLAAGASPAGLAGVVGNGFDEVGYAPVGRAVWAFPDSGHFGGGAVVGGGVNGWVVENGGGFVAGDCFPTWPELAISTPGNGFK